jgi:aspartyl-tRNA synthetase
MKFNRRTHTCGELNLSFEQQNVTLNGWVAKRRDLGGLLFIDIRDRYGVTQLKIVPEKAEIYEKALTLGNEFVISASGRVIKRESINKYMPTGDIEIDVEELEILNTSELTPFVVEDDIKASDDLKLQYRYLELRSPKLAKNLMIRNKVYQVMHTYFQKHNFVEVETPILCKSTPEGARDYLVPSRVHKGSFYALPQSPQLYKQILMVAGMDRYVQICKCFRDEDLRADRQPEFTQIDMEMSFVRQEDVFRMSEGFFVEVWKEVLGMELEAPFRQIPYEQAMAEYGSDKPDLRVKGEMKLQNISEIVKDSGFKVFSDALQTGGIVAGIKLEQQEASRKVLDSLTEHVKKLGFGGLGYIKYNADGVQSPMAKFLSEEILNNIKLSFGAKAGDIIFILSGAKKKVLTSLGNLRLKLANDFNLIDKTKYEFAWITDFPLFAYDEESGQFVAEHHLFTMPKDEFLPNLDSRNKEDIEAIRAYCYDLVLNGNEIISGSIRIHKPGIQQKVFDIIGLTNEEAREKFGFILEAFKYGAPPHGGIGMGFDRVVAILCGIDSIRDVIAFPKTISASSPMDESPSPVEKKQLDDLGIEVKKGH